MDTEESDSETPVPTRSGANGSSHPLDVKTPVEARADRPAAAPTKPFPFQLPAEFDAQRDRPPAASLPPWRNPSSFEARFDRPAPSKQPPLPTVPAAFDARTLRPVPKNATGENFLPTGTVNPRVARPAPATAGADPTRIPTEVELRHDRPLRREMPALPTVQGAVEIQADAGRQKVRVMTTGVFDLIHLGHIHLLEAAKKYGDELVVVIARDDRVRKMKHEPINPEEVRRQIVSALRPVDKAILGHQGDIYRTVEAVRPNVIALGYDQEFDEAEVRQQCASRGLDVRIVRLPEFDHDLDSTRKIIERIADRIGKKELYPNREA